MGHKKSGADLLDALIDAFGLSNQDVAKAAIKSDLAMAIISARMDAGLNQSELAQKLGKTQSTISKWESGDTNFTVDLLVDIAADLDLDLTIKLNKPVPKPALKSGSGYTTSTAIIYDFPKVYSGPSYCIENDEELKEM